MRVIVESPQIFKRQRKEKIPLPLIYYFLTAQLMFGVDFGFTAALKKNLRPFAKFLTFTISMIYVALVSVPLMFSDVWFWHNLAEYVLNLIVLMTTKHTLYNHIMNGGAMIAMTKKDKTILNLISNVHTMMILALKMILLILNCKYKSESHYCDDYGVVYYSFYMIPNLGVDTVSVGQLTIFYYTYMRVRYLKKSLQKEGNLRIFVKQYIKIADVCDKVRPLSDNLIILEVFLGVPKLMMTSWFMLLYIKLQLVLGLVFGVPKMVVTLYLMLLYIKKNAEWFTYITQVVFASHNAVQILFTSVFAEMVQAQVDDIKLLLNQRLILSSDEKESSEILRILRYMDARKLQHPVWRFIPTGVRLVLSLFNLCITYFIVIIQFTHLYD